MQRNARAFEPDDMTIFGDGTVQEIAEWMTCLPHLSHKCRDALPILRMGSVEDMRAQDFLRRVAQNGFYARVAVGVAPIAYLPNPVRHCRRNIAKPTFALKQRLLHLSFFGDVLACSIDSHDATLVTIPHRASMDLEKTCPPILRHDP